jgi:hypothetical protein
LTPVQHLKSLQNKKVNAVWRISDPLPFICFVTEKANGILKKTPLQKGQPRKADSNKNLTPIRTVALRIKSKYYLLFLHQKRATSLND